MVDIGYSDNIFLNRRDEAVRASCERRLRLRNNVDWKQGKKLVMFSFVLHLQKVYYISKSSRMVLHHRQLQLFETELYY